MKIDQNNIMSRGEINTNLIKDLAENYRPEELDRVKIIAFGQELNNLLNKTKSVCPNEVKYVVVEGYYGSGKTLFLRKYAHEAVNTIDNVIPIYVLVGEDGLALGDLFSSFVEEIEKYIQKGTSGNPRVVGHPAAWKSRLPIMGKVRQIINNELKSGKLSVEAFYRGMRELNDEGYCPILILDEFERLIYTGEGLWKTREKGRDFPEVGYFLSRFLELTRGHIFKGIIIVAVTRDILELLEMAKDENRIDHLNIIGRQIGINIVENPAHFPMVQPHIVYYPIKMRWDKEELLEFAKASGLQISENVIKSLAKVLPTPRALIQLAEKGVISESDLYRNTKSRFLDLKDALLKARTDSNRPLVTAQAKWLDRFEELLKHGIWYISPDRYLEVAKVWGIQYDENSKDDMRKTKQKVNEYLRELYSKRGLLDYEGQGTYAINSSIFAYLLEIKRLPNGQDATKENILIEIKAKVEEARAKEREKKSKKQEQ